MATVSVVVHEELDLTERIAVGELTVQSIMSEIKAFYGASITKHVMWNLSDASFTSLSSVDIEHISAAAAPLIRTRASGKSAVVATSDLGYGFSRMYQAYREMNQITLPYKCFRDRQEAIDWLTLDVP